MLEPFWLEKHREKLFIYVFAHVKYTNYVTPEFTSNSKLFMDLCLKIIVSIFSFYSYQPITTIIPIPVNKAPNSFKTCIGELYLEFNNSGKTLTQAM